LAALTAATVAILVHRYIVPYVTDNWFKGSAILEKFWAKRRSYDGGSVISVPIWNTSMSKATAFDGGITSITPTASLPLKEAQYKWKYYYAYWTWEMQEQVKYSGQTVVDVAVEKAKQSANDLSDRVATDFFSDGTNGAGAEDEFITGLAAMASATDPGASHYYGGLVVSSNSFWKAIHADGANTYTDYGGDGANFILTRDNLDKVLLACAYNRNDGPDLLACDKDVFRAMKSLFYNEPLVMYPDPKRPRLGFTEFDIAGPSGPVTVIWDTYCTANTIYIINTKHVWLTVHPNFQMTKTSLEEPTTYIGEMQKMKLACNLCCDSRNRQGIIQNVVIT